MLKNLSLRFDPVEDRLTLRLVLQPPGEGAPAEHWLHITRRVCAVWRQDLQAMVDRSAEAPAASAPPAKAALSRAHHQAMASQATVRIEPAASAPAPEQAPDLVTQITCGHRRSDGKWVIRFERRNLPSLSLLLSAQTLHALVDSVSRRIASAGWGLNTLPHETKAVELQGTDARLH